jgi:hypothetical protein
MDRPTAHNLIPDFQRENVEEQIDELLKTQNRELLLSLLRDQIEKAFNYAVQSNQHMPGYLKFKKLPQNAEEYLKLKGL